MSSWIFGSYSQNEYYVEYRWDKGNAYAVIVGHFSLMANGLVITDKHLTYATKEKARQSFLRQVRRIKQLCM